MEPIAKPITELAAEYDVVVVGSGYGASVAASRLARTRRRVCVLERGKEWLPGDFPEKLPAATEEFQVDVADVHVGDRQSLFMFHVDDDISVLSGCGLGGTSLINANVALEADPRVFETGWPRAVRDDADGRLRAGLDRARTMLGSNPLPDDRTPAKLAALQQVAEELGQTVIRPDLNITFTTGRNAAGVEQHACTGCGDCVTGCNESAKNTLRMNYLPDAVHHGAEIFTEVEVRHVRRESGRWVVTIDELDSPTTHDGATRRRSILADVVVLGAGALGSTEILLRSADVGLTVSPMLGSQFSGNGDILGFAYDTTDPIHGIGDGARPSGDRFPVGPTITGAIAVTDARNVNDSYLVEDGAVPGALAALFPLALTVAHPGDDDGATAILDGAYDGPIDHTLTYLVMGHDDAGGQLRLDGKGRLRIRWPGVGSQREVSAANQALEIGAKALGGHYIPNPAWSQRQRKPLVTVHPLGGCPMAEDATQGVVDDRGRVFSGATGSAFHRGLYVMDASVIPRPLGVNPLLTITALAERSADLLADEWHWSIDDGVDAPSVDAPVVGPVPESLSFSESMRGAIVAVAPGATPPEYTAAERAGEEMGTHFAFDITTVFRDVNRVIDDPATPGTLSGSVEASLLDEGRLTATGGSFQVFAPTDQPGLQLMTYRLPLRASDGRAWVAVGHKNIRPGRIHHVWADTTTLLLDVFEGEDGTGPLVARGVLHISLTDFVKLLTTMEVEHARSEGQRLELIAKFGVMFAGDLADRYGGVFASVRPLAKHPTARARRPLRCGLPARHTVRTADDVELQMLRFQGGSRGPVVMVHGAGASSGLFTTDTIDTNVVEYFWERDFDVWVLDWRSSIYLPSSHTMFSGDDAARYDYPAASDYIRAVTNVDDLHWLVHCVGSITFFMSVLGGLDHVASICALQVATHTHAPPITKAKCGLHIPGMLDHLGIDSLTAETHGESLRGRLFNQMLRATPLPDHERCNSAVCLRCTFLYGLCWKHEHLTTATHDSIHEMMGVTNMRIMAQMARCAVEGHLVGADGEEIYMPYFDRLQMPITLIQGEDNQVWELDATQETYDALSELHDDGRYERHIIPGYGHLDTTFGRNAARDSYPTMFGHFDRVGA